MIEDASGHRFMPKGLCFRPRSRIWCVSSKTDVVLTIHRSLRFSLPTGDFSIGNKHR
jgi:hypothetical protein